MTITTSAAHGLVSGQTVLIAGFVAPYTGYNGTYTLTSAPSTTTFTYTDSTSGLGKSGGGTVTGYGLTESGNTVTVWTTAAHGLTVNEPVTICGAGVAGYNGTFTIKSLPGGAGGTTFTYTDANTGLATSGSGMAALARGIPISLRGAQRSDVGQVHLDVQLQRSGDQRGGGRSEPGGQLRGDVVAGCVVYAGQRDHRLQHHEPLAQRSHDADSAGRPDGDGAQHGLYKAKDLLHFSSVSLQAGGSSVAAIGTDALHLVAFLGNASASGAITSGDGLDMARVVAGADTGFAAYQLTDPDIIADMLGDGAVGGPDGAAIGRYINGATVPQMPIFPGNPANNASGPTPP